VVEDMVEGVVVANRMAGDGADALRIRLREAVMVVSK